MAPSIARSAVLIATTLALVTASRLATANIGDENLGLNAHVPSNDLLDMARDVGVGWIRVDANWNDMNPARGMYQWTEMDRVVDEARTRGLRVYMTAAYTPMWVPRVARARTDTYPGNDEPLGSTEWTDFVTQLVTHYRARAVTHYGIWNEANLGGFWESGAGMDAWIDKILIPGAAAVRAACTDCLVLGPDLAHVGAYDTMLDRVLSRAATSIDILTHHIYNGWPETGTTIFSGDNFLQALETRRFSFTRPALREVLDAHMWTREVWITETGYRARPGDAIEEGRQATYVRRVMEEQLSRAWWTNSFFYEITDCGVDDPACPIDGFGITRPTRAISMGPRMFPRDYRLKPAYDTIRGFITAHPEIVMRRPPSQCADGRDNDMDGRIDSTDRGCLNGLDNDESDDPPRRRIDAIPAPTGGITVDGNLSEWTADGWVGLGAADWAGVVMYGGVTDLSARLAARWTTDTLYLALQVDDDRQTNNQMDDTLYLGDSVQIAFDLARNYGDAYDRTDDHELNFALARSAPRGFRFVGPAAATTGWTVAVTRVGARTNYEIRLPAAVIVPAMVRAGAVFGFSFLVNDNDGQITIDGTGREGWLEFTRGIGVRKEPYYFGELHVIAGPATTDAGALPDIVGLPDNGTADDTGPGDDAGVDMDSAIQDDAGVDARPSGDSATRPPSGCACRAGHRSRGRGGAGLALLLCALACTTTRRRRTHAPTLPIARNVRTRSPRPRYPRRHVRRTRSGDVSAGDQGSDRRDRGDRGFRIDARQCRATASAAVRVSEHCADR